MQRRWLASARPAFPDDFVAFAKRLESRLKEKHNRQSDEGRALRALREIRVQASPSWDASKVTLMFYFIRHDQQADFEGMRWNTLLEVWKKLIMPAGRFTADAVVITLDRMTAEEYVHSDRLDLDHLSSRNTT